MRLLLIDDDEDDQTLFCEAIKLIAPNIKCDVATNGRDGLVKLAAYPELPSMLFLDINMPILDGKETFKIIRGTPRFNSLPITIYSTSNNPDERHSFLMAGANYITKPNSFEALVSLLSKPIGNLLAKKFDQNYNTVGR